MAKLILTSDGIDSKEIKEEFEKVINNKTKIAIITTAKEEKENSNGAKKIHADFLKMKPNTIDFIDIEFQDPDILYDYDLIHLIGGNPFRLMHFLDKVKAKNVFDKLIKVDKKVISGTSAGSMVLGSDMGICSYLSPEMNDVELKNFKGLCLTEINVCPHYNNFPKMYQNCNQKVKTYEKDNNIIITKIVDGQALIIDTERKTMTSVQGEVINMENLDSSKIKINKI